MFRRDVVSALALSILLLFAGCTAGVSPASPSTAAARTGSLEQGVTVTVVEVTDGDTMDVRFANGSKETVRLLGVDTPEVYAENTPSEWDGVPETQAGRDWLRQWGTKASEFAKSELDGERVEIRVDSEADRRGGYGRLLVYLSTPDSERSFNRRLLDEGYARLYDTPFSKRDVFATAEADARDAGRGVWGFEEGTDSQTTASSKESPLTLVEINADAAGNDNENLDDEYLIFENTGSESLDISGWTISDSAGHTYTVPDGVQLAAGARIRLVTGSGSDTESTLYWGEDQALWNNGGDTVTVRTASGELVLRESYPRRTNSISVVRSHNQSSYVLYVSTSSPSIA
ncbi:lamin tail domain-containing protein [Salinigranum halophilum]|uniref:lamin tail domain-containing protein n=1 Tax=Salinigranum halophilum TaxID=2565931 RepID=UPI0010A7B09E|nr:lamin tail domain-containing protein [Salinigranum halophilum]